MTLAFATATTCTCTAQAEQMLQPTVDFGPQALIDAIGCGYIDLVKNEMGLPQRLVDLGIAAYNALAIARLRESEV